MPSGPQLLHGHNDEDQPMLHGVVEGLSEGIRVKCLADCLGCGCEKLSINAGCHHYLGK